MLANSGFALQSWGAAGQVLGEAERWSVGAVVRRAIWRGLCDCRRTMRILFGLCQFCSPPGHVQGGSLVVQCSVMTRAMALGLSWRVGGV
jgi:hypothetical protein